MNMILITLSLLLLLTHIRLSIIQRLDRAKGFGDCKQG